MATSYSKIYLVKNLFVANYIKFMQQNTSVQIHMNKWFK